MRTSLKAWVQLLLGLSLLTGIIACSETPARFVKKQQQPLNAALDNLNALAAKSPAEAPSSDKIALPAGGPPMDLTDMDHHAYQGNANAQLFTVQDLTDPDEKSPAMHLFPARAAWRSVNAMVKDERYPESKEESLKVLKRFANWRYAVVIRARTVQAPQVASPPVSTSVTENRTYSSGTFTAGSIEGDVLVYDLNDGAFLGGFPFTAQNSPSVESVTYGGGTADPQKQLERDMIEQIRKAALYGMMDRLPESSVTMDGMLRQRVKTERGK